MVQFSRKPGCLPRGLTTILPGSRCKSSPTLSPWPRVSPATAISPLNMGRGDASPAIRLAISWPTARTEDGLAVFARFHPVLATNHLEFVESAGPGPHRMLLSGHHIERRPDHRFVLMRFVSRIRARSEALAPRLRRPDASATRGYLRIRTRLGPRISFDQPLTHHVSAATLALPMPNADPQLFHLVKRYCEEEIERQKSANHPLNGFARR